MLSAINLTIAPTLVGGVRSVQSLLPHATGGAFPRLASPVYVRAGEDMVIQGRWAVE